MVIYCSPRKNGYSARYLQEAVAGYREVHPDAEIVPVYLNDLNMKGCQHCGACKADDAKPFCIIDDDLKTVLQTTLHCDAVLWGIPNYMSDYNAQAKILIDRYYGYMGKESRLPAAQKSAVIMVQGNPDEGLYKQVEEFMMGFLGQRGRRVAYGLTIGGCRGKDGSFATDEGLSRAREIGKKLAT